MGLTHMHTNRDTPSSKPILLHIKTEKGMGYPPAMAASDKVAEPIHVTCTDT